jgi:alpha-D-ribose 1-methylphosphonate 5-triphosphate synthase subunit PhnH
MQTPTLQPGLHDPVHDAQRSFRAALQALSRPGRIQALGAAIGGLPLGAALSHLLLTLTDETTPVWWQQDDPRLAQWLRFHTGAPAAAQPRDAAFAVITQPLAMPPLDAFALGSLASPEFSTTLLVEVPSLDEGEPLRAQGPGIRDSAQLRIAGLPAGFWAQWQANHAGFPQGVDLIFSCGAQVLGLPRTTRVTRPQEA